MAFLNKLPSDWTLQDWQQYWLIASGFWIFDQLYGAALHGSLAGLNSKRPAE